MTGTSTPSLQLYKPDRLDNINVLTDLNANSDKIDTAVGGLKLGTRGARYVQSVPQTLATGGDKVKFDTVTKAGTLITPSGTGNTDFAVGATGWVMVGANIRYGSGVSSPYLAIRRGTSEIAGNNHANAADGFINKGATTAWYATSGDTFNAFVNLSQTLALDATGLTNFWIVYLGL